MLLRILIPLGLTVACWAQQAAPSRINIKVIGGEGAINNVPMRVAAQPAVEITDDKGAPVEGAEVIFHIPANGPGGSFFGGMSTNTLKTDAKGQVKATGFVPNDRLGKFAIMVRATSGAAVAEAVINQTNGEGAGSTSGSKMSSNKKVWIIVGIAAAAAIGIGIGVSQSGDSTSSTTAKKPVSIGAGPITIGGPR